MGHSWGQMMCLYQKNVLTKFQDFFKRNWPRAAHFEFTMGFVLEKISKNLKSSFWELKFVYMNLYVTQIRRRIKLNQSVLWKKSVWSRKIRIIWDLRFLPLQWSSIVMAKIINLKLIKFFLIKLIFFFFIKQTGLVWSFSICGWHMSSYKQVLVPKMKILGFWRFLPL